jgi:D-alanyl-D-alanine carboxypeptidase (penicillin-binding protein 5/6)
MKKRVVFILFLILTLSLVDISTGQDAMKIDCEGGAILVEYGTSNVVFEQDADKKWPPASLTKVMTAIIALEHGDLSDEVRFSKNATQQEKSILEINEGVRIPLYQLIEAMLIKSGNDASVAIAEHISGSEAEFVKLMNNKAQQLGMQNTNFANSSGLPSESQYSTARDIATMCIYAMGREDFRQIVGKRECQFVSPDGKEVRTIYSTNKLLGHHPLVDGIKTGYITASKYCLAGSAIFRDYRLIAVVLGSGQDSVWNETARLLDYGFEIKDPLYPLYREFDPIPKKEIEEGME